MLFNKIKGILYSSGFASSGAYRPYKKFKTTLANVDTVKSNYDPLQLKEQADDSGYDPHFSIGTQETICMPEGEDDGDYQKIDKLQDASDKTKGMSNTDKTEGMNNVTDEDGNVYYDSFEYIDTTDATDTATNTTTDTTTDTATNITDALCDSFEIVDATDTTGTTHTADTTVPVSERLFSSAALTAGSVANNTLWGAMTAAHYVNKGKKTVKKYYKDINKKRNSPPPSQCHPLFDDTNNGGTSVIRGYGVDFPYPTIFDKIPFMKSKTSASETRVFELRCDERKLYERLSGKHTNRPIDESWGFIESGYTVQFKPTRSSVQELPTEAPAVNKEKPNTM